MEQISTHSLKGKKRGKKGSIYEKMKDMKSQGQEGNRGMEKEKERGEVKR